MLLFYYTVQNEDAHSTDKATMKSWIRIRRKAPLKALYLYKTFRQICPKIGDDVIKTSKYIFYFKAVHSTDREPMSAVRGEQIKIYIVDTWQDTLASKTKI